MTVLFDSATTLNFASQDFLKRNNLLGRCIRGPKMVVRIANEQRISTTITLSPTNISICHKKFIGLSFTALPHLYCVDFIFGLPAMKEFNMSIQPSMNLVLIADIPFLCESQPRRISCLLVDSSKMHKILAKATRSKHTESELLLMPFHFAEELESIKADFGPELDTQLKELVTHFADVTQEQQGLPPHRGIFDHKIRLTSYPKRQRRNHLYAPEYEKIKRQCTDLFKEGLVRVSTSPYAAPVVMARKLDGSIRVCVDYIALIECTMKESFSLPQIDDLLDKLRSAKCMTHLDLRSTYN